MGALPRHKTATTSVAWDGPENEKNIKTPVTHKVADGFWAWQDPSKDSTTKAAYSLPHHEVSADGVPGAANVKGCTAAIGVLNGAMGGSSIPKADAHAVWEHLQAHLQDSGMKTSDIPELKSHGQRPVARSYRANMRGNRETRVPVGQVFELREIPNGSGGNDLRFTGYACVTSSEYEMEDWLGPWTERVQSGAFARTLREGADVAFLLNHEGMTLARTKPGTLRLSEDSKGLHTEAMLDPTNPVVSAMRSAVERGDLDEMSMAFRTIVDRWNDDFDDRTLVELSLNQGDVSLVNYAANGATSGTVAMRRRGERRGGPSMLTVLAVFRELREGKQFSSNSMSVLQQILTWCSDADDAMDQAQIVLSGLLGVSNPDDDDQWDGLTAANAGDDGDDGDAPPSATNGPDATLSAPLPLDDYRQQLAALVSGR